MRKRMNKTVVKEQIGDGIELLIEGLPKSKITPMEQANTALALIQHGIPMAASFSAGVIGGIRTAILKISGEYYKLKFSFVAQRAITALEIYSQTIQYIEFQMMHNRVDSPLGEATIKYLREDLMAKQRKWKTK